MGEKMKTETKVCNKCKKKKGITEFKDTSYESLSGMIYKTHPWCDSCRIETKKKYENVQEDNKINISFNNYKKKNGGNWPVSKYNSDKIIRDSAETHPVCFTDSVGESIRNVLLNQKKNIECGLTFSVQKIKILGGIALNLAKFPELCH